MYFFPVAANVAIQVILSNFIPKLLEILVKNQLQIENIFMI